MKKKTWLIIAMGLSFAPGALADIPKLALGVLPLSQTPAESHKCLLSEASQADLSKPIAARNTVVLEANGAAEINGSEHRR